MNKHLENYLARQIGSQSDLLVHKVAELQRTWRGLSTEELLDKLDEVIEIAKSFEILQGIVASSAKLELDLAIMELNLNDHPKIEN